MLVRAAGTGDWSQTASISASTDTARLRFISSVASTARCLGAPSGTRASPALSCKGPRTPNWRPAFDIARQPSGSTWVCDHHCDLDWLPRGATARLWPLHAQQGVRQTDEGHAHPRAARSEETTSSAEPVVE